MDVRNALKALQIGKEKGKTYSLSTGFTICKEGELPFPEYPRPQMRRENWTNLNGWWDYAFTKTQKRPEQRDGKILVPFSPESDASGVKRQLQPDEYLWYFRTIDLPEIPHGKRLLLQMGAVDQDAVIYCNGVRAGAHLGGYLSFSVDLTSYIKKGENEIAVKVRDETDTGWKGRGKQSLTPGGMFYTAQSGIWQSVWMEWVPEIYIERIVLTPEYDTASVKVQVILNQEKEGLVKKITVREKEDRNAKVLCSRTTKENEAELILGSFQCWSPEHPYLYGITIEAGNDCVWSYFGMRKVTVEKDADSISRIFLNGKPYFQNGVLDQGYWPESLYTPPSEEAMVYDIQMARHLGFRMIRKHLKVECQRWYYHCDHIGMLVWQDMINGGGRSIRTFLLYLPTVLPFVTTEFKDNCYPLFSRTSKTGRKWWERECRETVAQLYNTPSVVLWVLFNEGWGQFDAKKMTEMVRQMDPTRLIDHASGWYDQGAGDVKSLHNYFRRLKVVPEERAFVFSEYGGCSYPVPGHQYAEHSFGYRSYQNPVQYQKAMDELAEKIRHLEKEGLAAAVYTQLSDVEEETNGILAYDRKVCKWKK